MFETWEELVRHMEQVAAEAQAVLERIENFEAAM
jgi:hypothetical protein